MDLKNIKPVKYPNKTVFAKKVDDKQREYYTAYSNHTSKAVVHLKNQNIIIEGNPKISVRIGKSKFGEEVIFELLRTGTIETTKKRTGYDSVEIYLPKDKGIKFLEETLKFLKEKLNTRR